MANPHLQQDTLMKFKALYRFVAQYAAGTAKDIRDEYIDTMSKIHVSYFKTYVERLLKLQYAVADKDDLMGVEDTPKRAGFFGAKAARLKHRATVFTVGDRGKLLAELDAPIIVPHTAKEMRGKAARRFTYERLFRRYVQRRVTAPESR